MCMILVLILVVRSKRLRNFLKITQLIMTEPRFGAFWSVFPACTICIILFILELRLTKLGVVSRERNPLARYNFVRKTCGKVPIESYRSALINIVIRN